MLPIRLQTEFGLNQFNLVLDQFACYVGAGKKEEFQGRCKEDFERQNKYLEYFLDDAEFSHKYKMDDSDIEGFKIFNEASDVCSVLKYFAEKAY